MAQNDLLILQNVHASGTEFTERYLNIAKGGLLSAAADGSPSVLAVGTNGWMLVADSTTATGLKWQAVPTGHTQNTDTGTTNQSFTIASGSAVGKIIIDVTYGSGDFFMKLTNEQVTANQTLTLPNETGILATRNWVTNQLAAMDAMVFKGTVGTGGTLTISAFNALQTYEVGWTYRVITAGTLRGVVCEPGDMITALVKRSGSGAIDSDWTTMQTNLDGAVIGPASSTDGFMVLFDGISGKLIKAAGGAPGSMAFANTTEYVAKAAYTNNTILYATTAGNPVALTVGASTLIGRKASGDIAALSPAEIMNVICVAAPATKTSTGTFGQIAFDNNFGYRCTATNVWKRFPLATNW
jgi:hypothetical protein